MYLLCISGPRFISNGSGEDQSFEPLATKCSRSYKVRFEDIGRCLKCECFVIDIFGRSSELVSAVTAPILPGLWSSLFQNTRIALYFTVHGNYLYFDNEVHSTFF